jgi:hypothetical protein
MLKPMAYHFPVVGEMIDGHKVVSVEEMSKRQVEVFEKKFPNLSNKTLYVDTAAARGYYIHDFSVYLVLFIEDHPAWPF